MQKKIIITGDGSPSFYISELNETYHSKHGAVTESDYVYIKRGLVHWLDQNNQKKLKVFEMGMGTGLNVYLSYVFSINHKISCEYFSIEKYPLQLKEIQSLNMKVSLPAGEHHHFFDQLHQLEWNQMLSQSDFSFTKIKEDFLNMALVQSFDVLFYDAFGYNAQSEMWQEKALQKCYDLLNPGGIWVSYCAKGAVRRSLEKIGFVLERLEGPPGKREMLRAVKEV
ncbi:MAG: tRNA (5-methylaminomethyl-2-thiouridine)(34)-methyltransferase MnmD [Bacteroidota bacterium]|nr:tRNA (5-methylaminomethyl-2-thiouridine)(34)-methyltransferase MnmD [Bacteroidota bacterium]MEC9134660.1 tRNA (5-methylaminomethyl-2-thiouridine)(34)-methyltransferase MnmD [Bacteroidota bacterium]